jgi:hypothetical protein
MTITPLTKETVLDKLGFLTCEERSFLREIQGDRNELPDEIYRGFLKVRRQLAERSINHPGLKSGV